MSDEKDLSLEKDKKQNEVDYSCGLESEEEHAAVYPEEEKEEGCCCGEDHECNCEGDDGCGCGCGHDHDHEHPMTVTMENEDGTTAEYPIVDEFEIDGKIYVLIENPDGTVTPLRAEGEEGDLAFLTEEEFNEVSEAYDQLLDGEEEEDEFEEDEE